VHEKIEDAYGTFGSGPAHAGHRAPAATARAKERGVSGGYSEPRTTATPPHLGISTSRHEAAHRTRRRRLPLALRQRSTIGFFMCVPLFLIVFGLVLYPAIFSIYLSMLNKRMTQFVGLGNLFFLLKRDVYRMVIEQSVLFAVSAVVLKALMGFVIAHLLHNVPSRSQRIWRGLILLPWVIPLPMSTLGWWWMFDPSYSAINWVLTHLGLPSVPWLGSPGWARFSIILVNAWFGAPFFMIMYLAALKSVPGQMYEAASIDGARAWQKLVFITLPMMRNVISVTVLFSLIVTFANFDIVRILTNGGPQDQTHVFATYAFQVGIQSGDIPLGATVSLTMLPVLAVFAFFILRGVSKRAQEAM
jgi:multiple sugar transport system permease protein